jgi:hypothetical protein
VVCITSPILWCIIARPYNYGVQFQIPCECKEWIISFCKHDSIIYYRLVWLMHSSDSFWYHYILRWPSLVLVTCRKYFVTDFLHSSIMPHRR